MTELWVTPRSAPDEIVLEVAGELRFGTVPVFKAAVSNQIAATPDRLVIDLAGVAFCDSSGLAELLRARHAATERRCDFLLANVPPRIRRLLEMTGLADFLPAKGCLVTGVGVVLVGWRVIRP